MGSSARPEPDLDALIAARRQALAAPADDMDALIASRRAAIAPPEPERPGLLSRVGQNITGAVEQIVTHPIDTAAGLVTAPVKSLFTAAVAPSVGEARHSAALSKGGNSSGRPIDTSAYDTEHGAVTGKERTAATAQTLVNVAFPGIASGVGRRAITAGLPAAAGRVLGIGAAGGAAGAAYSPDDPLAGGIAGAIVAPVLGETVRAAGAAGGRGVTALGLRPTGRSAAEIARDAATMRAPVGPQAGAAETPVTATNAGNSVPQPAQRGPVVPNTTQRVRAAFGSGVERTGVESARTLALRELARRLELDNVTPADAVAFGRQNAGKPVAALDLGGGNVAGLARTAKDVPGLGRRIIPDFLRERSAGRGPTEGATLARVTADVEQRIGLKPEDYFKTADEMATEQKAASKADYDKVRNVVVDDPDVLALFDEPEFQAIHERLRANARLGGKEKIPPLVTSDVVDGKAVKKLNPQTLGTLDKVKRQLDKVIQGKSDAIGPVDRDLAYNMRERVNEILGKLDEQIPDYGKARAGYRGRAEAEAAFEQGKADGYLDPRLVTRTIEQLPEAVRDLYRRGQYDALRVRLGKMKDGRNIGAFLEDNPDIRARVAALAKSPEAAAALRGDIGTERAMGDRKDHILGGPNTAERLIEHWSTVPMVTQAGNLARKVPLVGNLGGELVDNILSRRFSEQTGDVMGEVAKLMTQSGPDALPTLVQQIEALRAADRTRLTSRSNRVGRASGIATGQSQSDRQ